MKTVEETWPAVDGRIAGGELVHWTGVEKYDDQLFCGLCRQIDGHPTFLRAGDLLVEWEAGEHYYLLPCNHIFLVATPRRRRKRRPAA